MCPLSIVDLWFFRNFLLRSIGQFSLNSFTRFHFPALPSCGIWRTCVPKPPQFIQRWSIETSIRQAGLRLVYHKQRLRRLSANKRKLVWKVLQTRLGNSICFLSLFEFRLVHPKIKFSSTCFGNIKYKTKKTVLLNCHFIFSCTLAMIDDFCTVAWPDLDHTRSFITQHSI